MVTQMSHSTIKAVVVGLLQLLLVAILLWIAWEFRVDRLKATGSGVIFFILSACLAGLSTKRRYGPYFLCVAYLSLLIGLLNYLAAPGLGRLDARSSALSVVLGLLYFVLQVTLVFVPVLTPTAQFPLAGDKRNLVYRIGVSTSSGLFVGLVVVGSLLLGAHWSKSSPGPEPLPWWNAYIYAFLFAALFSAAESLSLFFGSSPLARPIMNYSRVYVSYIIASLTLIAVTELIVRRNWFLFFLSALALTGSALVTSMVWHQRDGLERTS